VIKVTCDVVVVRDASGPRSTESVVAAGRALTACFFGRANGGLHHVNLMSLGPTRPTLYHRPSLQRAQLSPHGRPLTLLPTQQNSTPAVDDQITPPFTPAQLADPTAKQDPAARQHSAVQTQCSRTAQT
jgi:hypothetical protein